MRKDHIRLLYKIWSNHNIDAYLVNNYDQMTAAAVLAMSLLFLTSFGYFINYTFCRPYHCYPIGAL